MIDKKQFYVKNPHGVVNVLGESEIPAIKRHIEAGLAFEILGPANDPDSSTGGTSVELPRNQERSPLECLTCGFTAETPEELTTHLEKHIDPSERSSKPNKNAKRDKKGRK